MATNWIRQEIKNPVGVNKSLDPTDIPLNVWSDVRNVSFKGGRARKTKGHNKVFGTLGGDPYYLLSAVRDGILYWIYPTLDSIYRTEGSNHNDITRPGGPYTGDESNYWNGGVLNSVPVLNNGVDVPQAWPYGSSTFEDIASWPSTLRAKVIRPYKNYLIAMNLTDNSVLEPHSIAWSTAADPGFVPDSWADNDPTKESGRAFLADTSGAIVDGRPLRDMFMIYKEDSVYSMRYVGGVFVWQFRQVFNDVGMMAQDCVAEFEGQHFVVTQGDVYVHNGVNKQSVIDNKNREYLFSAIDPSYFSRTRVFADYSNTEMWICFVSTDSETGYADTALIWNWIEDTWTIRDLPDISTGAYGVVDPQTPDDWDADSGTWNTDSTVWNDRNYNPAKLKILLCSPVNNSIYLLGDTSLFDTESFTSTLEKSSMYFDDDHSFKSIQSITPHVMGDGVITARVGYQRLQSDPITWKGPYVFNIGSDYKIDCKVTGRYISVRFDIESTSEWVFNGYTLEGNSTIGTR
jgi:hypothetical protein